MLVAVALVMTGSLGAVAAAPVASAIVVAAKGELSDSGQSAIADLRTCLQSQDVLNVYYLIDASGSLKYGKNPSDPAGLRAPILANSLEQLGGIDEGAVVNWSAGFFGDDFLDNSEIGWREYQPGAKDQLKSAIDALDPTYNTNWQAGLAHAQSSLAAQQQTSPGCQLLIWLTDGQLDLVEGDSDKQAIADALNAMCGSTLSAGGAPANGYGVFNALRQSGVVVVGALLATTEAAARAGQVMQPLVEGRGVQDGAEVTCGEQPMPAGYVNGAFVEANEPSALALLFLGLGVQVDGGYPQPFNADGSFVIDDGIARFAIVLAGPWTLTAPGGQRTISTDAPGDGVTIADSSVEVKITRDEQIGTWKLESGDVRSLFLFSDLSIRFDEQNAVAIGEDGLIDATLRAQVVDDQGKPASLSAFAVADFHAWLVTPEGPQPLPGAEVAEETGAITIPLPESVTTAEITVSASLDPLRTSQHQLAPVTTNDTITTQLPSNFPSIAKIPVQLDPLEGASGEARGAITVDGPKSGGDGSVCLPSDPEVISDSAARADTWEWDLSRDLRAGCVVVKEGATGQRIQIIAKNSVAADSTVDASVGVTFISASGSELTQNVPITFRSTHPVNPWALILLTLGLLALGILLPLLALWFLNWRTTRLDVDNGIQRARFAARVGPSGVTFLDAPASDSALAERFQYRKPEHNVRSIDDPDLGRLTAHVPWLPLLNPTYRVTPPQATTIVAARSSARATSAGVRRDNGSMEFRQLPLDAFWALTVTHAELERTSRGDDVNGTVVLYHRLDPSQQDQYRTRLTDIGHESSVGDAVDRARGALAARAKKPDNGVPARTTGDATKRSIVPAREGAAPPRDTTPPPRGGTTPPPRGGSNPPPRGDTTPPPSGASGSTPPPRPGSTPPPRGR